MRCIGKTKSGERCNRNTSHEFTCWQHRQQELVVEAVPQRRIATMKQRNYALFLNTFSLLHTEERKNNWEMIRHPQLTIQGADKMIRHLQAKPYRFTVGEYTIVKRLWDYNQGNWEKGITYESICALVKRNF